MSSGGREHPGNLMRAPEKSSPSTKRAISRRSAHFGLPWLRATILAEADNFGDVTKLFPVG